MPEGIFFEVFALVLGLLVGSFLNVCIVRLPKEESIVTPASHCPYCKTTIRWYDNVPVLSWLMLRGRCRNPACRQRISLLYPVIEATTAILFWLTVHEFGPTLEAAKWILLLCLLLVHAVTDLRERFLSFRMNVFGIAVGLLASAIVAPQSAISLWLADHSPAVPLPVLNPLLGFAEGFVGALFGAGILWIVSEGYFRLTGREGMGLGDVYLVGMIGAFVGVKLTFLTILLGSLLGSIVGVLWIAVLFASGWKLKVAERAHRMGRGGVAVLRFALARRYPLPFGTYLSLAAGVLIFQGARLLQMFSEMLGLVE